MSHAFARDHPDAAPRADAVAAAAVDEARAALARGGRRRRRRRPPRPRGRRRAGRSPTSSSASAAGYVGWRWAVTLARASRQKRVTVDEVVLLPGDDAIVAPEWVPYRERLKPGDLSPGDLLPVADDDPRLVPTYSFGDDPLDADDKAQIRSVAKDLGLGRVRTLSIEGRDLAAERWYDGPGGPDAQLAKSAPEPCSTCGFLVRIAGPPVRDVRGVRQRRRQRRRPRGGLRPRLRRALGGAARQEAHPAAAARARLRHGQRSTSIEGLS